MDDEVGEPAAGLAASDWARPAGDAESRIALHELLGMWPRVVEGGQARVELEVEPRHLRAGTIMHGGVFAVLLDSAQGMAAASLARAGHDVVTAQLNVNFVRPARVGERLIATGHVLHHGRRTAVTRGEVHSADGQLMATGSATLMYLAVAPAAE